MRLVQHTGGIGQCRPNEYISFETAAVVPFPVNITTSTAAIPVIY